MAEKVYVVAAGRSAFGKYLGGLCAADPLDLVSQVVSATLARSGLDVPRAGIERIFVGNCFSISFATASVVGRQLGLKVGSGAFSLSVDTACCSTLTALRMALQSLRGGESQSALVAGVEVMSRIPHVARGLRGGVRIGAVSLEDPVFPIEYKGYAPVAVDAAKGAERYGVTRAEMDRWALASHQRYAAALAAHSFADEVVQVKVRDGRKETIIAADEQPRPDTTYEKLAALPGIFGTTTITAGNAPGLNDGATALLLMTASRAAEIGVEPLAEIVDAVGVTEAPDGISWVPATAIASVLSRTSKPLADVHLIEINEAFAAMPVVSTKVLAGSDGKVLEELRQRTNAEGGAVAIGHPVGASGLRLVMTLARQLKRRGGGNGVAAICGGLSQGEAVMVSVGSNR